MSTIGRNSLLLTESGRRRFLRIQTSNALVSFFKNFLIQILSDYQAVVFKNTAGLGDSANALSAAFMYTINAGLMFFIDWKPWAWSDAFSGPGFPVDYQALLADNQICQGRNVIHLSGHITAKHRLAMIKRG